MNVGIVFVAVMSYFVRISHVFCLGSMLAVFFAADVSRDVIAAIETVCHKHTSLSYSLL